MEHESNQKGEIDDLQVITLATTIVGSPELNRLVKSSPWPVYAIGVGGDVITAQYVELPRVLRLFDDRQLILLTDAYDVKFFPCDRSIVEEYRKLGADIVVSAEMQCWKGGRGCASCEERHKPDSKPLRECQFGAPYLNSGGILGTAAAIARAFSWMHERSYTFGSDQLAWHLYYDEFPDRVVLDHGMRIWVTLHGLDLRMFNFHRMSSGVRCGGVMNNYTGEPVCVLHANSVTRSYLRKLDGQIAKECGFPAPLATPKIRAVAGVGNDLEKMKPRRI